MTQSEKPPYKVTPYLSMLGQAILPWGLLCGGFIVAGIFDRAQIIFALVIAVLAFVGMYFAVLRIWNDYMLISPDSTTLRFKVGRHAEETVDLSQIVEISSKSARGSRVIIKYRSADGQIRGFHFDVVRTPGVDTWFKLIKAHKSEIGHILTKSGHEVQTAVETNPEGD